MASLLKKLDIVRLTDGGGRGSGQKLGTHRPLIKEMGPARDLFELSCLAQEMRAQKFSVSFLNYASWLQRQKRKPSRLFTCASFLPPSCFCIPQTKTSTMCTGRRQPAQIKLRILCGNGDAPHLLRLCTSDRRLCMPTRKRRST